MDLLFAQIPGADELIKSASRESWIAVFLVVLVLAIVATFGYVLKKQMQDATERENRLNVKQDATDVYIRTTMADLIRENSKVIQQVLDVLAKCKAVND
jgi:uncharacterized protein HemX